MADHPPLGRARGGDPLVWPDALRDRVTTELARPRTVWTARALLAPYRGRAMAFRMDDGQHAAARRYALYHDLMSRPDWGLTLVVRGLGVRPSTGADPHRRCRTALPLSLLTALPDPFRFLQEDRPRWPVPPPFAQCLAPDCGADASTGRFCVRCGHVVRQGPGSHWWGEGFVATQRALRWWAGMHPAMVVACGCGAVHWHTDAVCTKCGAGRPTARS